MLNIPPLFSEQSCREHKDASVVKIIKPKIYDQNNMFKKKNTFKKIAFSMLVCVTNFLFSRNREHLTCEVRWLRSHAAVLCDTESSGSKKSCERFSRESQNISRAASVRARARSRIMATPETISPRHLFPITLSRRRLREHWACAREPPNDSFPLSFSRRRLRRRGARKITHSILERLQFVLRRRLKAAPWNSFRPRIIFIMALLLCYRPINNESAAVAI